MQSRINFSQLCKSVRFRLDEECDGEPVSERHKFAFLGKLRSTALRVTALSSPRLYEMVMRVQESLALAHEPEVYVVNDSEVNAFAPLFGNEKRPVAILNSGLVRTLERGDLSFVLGHELGHLGLGHNRVLTARERLENWRTLSAMRAAEISADRVGLLASRSLFVAARVMLQLASGLPAEMIGIDIRGFLIQAQREAQDSSSRAWELEEMHPSLPFRLWALVRFAASTEYLRASESGGTGVDLSSIDEEIAAQFLKIGDGLLAAEETEFLEKSIAWGAVCMALRDGSSDAIDANKLASMLPGDSLRKAIEFAKAHSKDQLLAKLREASARLQGAGPNTRREFVEEIRKIAGKLDYSVDDSEVGRILSRFLRSSTQEGATEGTS